MFVDSIEASPAKDMAMMSAAPVSYDYGRGPSWGMNRAPSSSSSSSTTSSRHQSSSPRSRPGLAFFPVEGAATRDARAYAHAHPTSPTGMQGHYRNESQSTSIYSDAPQSPGIRVTAPSMSGQANDSERGTIGTIPDEEESVYDGHMSSLSTGAPQNYYSPVFQSGRASAATISSGNFNQLFASESSPTATAHHMSSLTIQSELARDSWQTTGSTLMMDKEPARPESNVDPFSFMEYESARGQVPKVVVSSPADPTSRASGKITPQRISSPRASNSALNGLDRLSAVGEDEEVVVIPQPVTPPPFQPQPGRVPSAVPGAARNFSRPVRPAAPTDTRPPLSSYSSSSSLNKPSRPPSVAKYDVIERVQQQRRMQNGGSPVTSPAPSASSSSSYFPPVSHSGTPYTVQDQDARTGAGAPSRPSRSPSPLYPQAFPQDHHNDTRNQSQTPRSLGSSQNLVVLPPSRPKMQNRPSSSETLYSQYSYYNLDTSNPSSPISPSGSMGLSPVTSPSSRKSASPTTTLAPTTYSPSSSPSKQGKSPTVPKGAAELPTTPQTADDFLALGIAHHEADRLTESAACFEKAALLESGGGLGPDGLQLNAAREKGVGKDDEGSAVGMLMWGLSLRHGWGVAKDEPQAFKWLKAAAEHAVVDLQKGAAKSGKDVVRVSLAYVGY